jgi:hypothetical protein
MSQKMVVTQGVLVIVGGKAFDKVLIETLQKTIRSDFRGTQIELAATREDARAILEKLRC